MVRSTQLLHPHREPPTPRPAATVLLLRDGPAGLEVLMTRRSATASFAPGAYVFPGGAIDAADRELQASCRFRDTQPDSLRIQAVAAIRESFEELGILLADDGDGQPIAPERVGTLSRQTPLAQLCADERLRLRADAVYALAHWITDRDLPKRFDVHFLVARMPQGQEPRADESEQFEPVWIRPADALARHEAGLFFIIFPTIRTLQRLQAYSDVDAVLQACATEQPLWTSCPRAGLVRGADTRYMEHEAPYGELEMVCPDGQVLHPLDWRTDQAMPLLRNLIRLTAPNPGFMTGPGTNTYLVGDPNTGYIVIDPGPKDDEHQARTWRAAGGEIRSIVCTHSHSDHSPGALPLQALCSKKPPILGLASRPTSRPASAFTPERELENGERLQLTPSPEQGGHTHTLQVIHTPGHAANHLCLLLEEDGLLFSGDHILNGSTTVIDPPDGDMSDYLDSLDTLDRVSEQAAAMFILPAHGHVLGQARQTIARLKAHRLAREAKVLAAMRAKPQGSMDDWVALAYDDVPPRIWPVAKRSLLAHVQRLEALQGND